MRVLSPVGERRQFAAKALGSDAQGRTIGLLNNGFGGEIADLFFARLKELLAAEERGQRGQNLAQAGVHPAVARAAD